MNIIVMFILGMFGFLGFILLLVIGFYAGKIIKAIVRWRKGPHE